MKLKQLNSLLFYPDNSHYFFRSCPRFASSWNRSNYFRGYFHKELPKGVKPTHIIVGAGSAGCTLANRLTEDPDNRVLLIEAGPKDDWWKWTIHMPSAMFHNLRDSDYNWLYYTFPQKELHDRAIYWPRGRIWGGSSSINSMVYIRGHRNDYNRWETEEGATGWSFKNCLPYFKRSQTYEQSKGEDDPFYGFSGPQYVSKAKCNHPLHQAFIDATKTLGIPYNGDINGPEQEGVGPFDLMIKDGVRCSSSAAYLKNIMDRSNLFLTSDIICSKVLTHRRRAIGVEIIRQEEFLLTEEPTSANIEKIYCEDAVILSAGSINSPQLLMLSGIGPASHLKALKIPLVQDMPGVGSNLQDHLEVHLQQKCTKPVSLVKKISPQHFHNSLGTLCQWVFTRSGIGASSHLESGAFLRSSREVAHPDIQFHFFPSTVHNDGRTFPKSQGYQLHAGTLRPKSRGTVRLISNDPRQYPNCDPKYLDNEEDLIDLRRSVQIAREIFAQKPFDQFRGEELSPGPYFYKYYVRC